MAGLLRPAILMKLWKPAVLIVAALIMIGCKKGDEIADSFTRFNIETDYVVQVPATPLASIPLGFVTPDIATHSEESFTANKTRADLVQHIELTELVLTVKAPEDGTLSFLKSVDIYARAEGLPEVRVAYKDVVPDDVGALLSLDVTAADLTEHFKKTTYQLRISVVSDERVTEDYQVNAHGKFAVDAKLLGE